MAGKSSQSNNRGTDLFGYFVSGKFKEYHTNQFAAPELPPEGHTATGGVISDYTTSPGDVYRAHVFTSSGALNITALGNIENNVEALVVAGGGGGGSHSGGGGGAGGLLLYGSPTGGKTANGSALTVGVQPVSYTHLTLPTILRV